MKKKPILILIAGEGGSGKSTMAEKIMKHIQQREKNKEAAVILQTDYLTNADLKNTPFPYIKDGVIDFIAKAEYLTNILNFDEDLMLDKIKEIINKEETKVVVLEGVFSLSFEKLRDFAGLKIYMSVDDDIRLIRRIQRTNYYKKIVGEIVDETKEEDLRNSNGNSLKDAFDLWIVRKKKKSSSYDYDKNVYAKKKFADLNLNNNYQENFEENTKKIIKFIDLYFEDEEQFKNQLREKNRESKNVLSLVEKVSEKSHEEIIRLQKEKDDLKQQIKQLQFQFAQQKEEQIAKFEEVSKYNNN